MIYTICEDEPAVFTDASAAAAVKVSTTTSYADHYPGKNVKFEKSVAAVHHDGNVFILIWYVLVLYFA